MKVIAPVPRWSDVKDDCLEISASMTENLHQSYLLSSRQSVILSDMQSTLRKLSQQIDSLGNWKNQLASPLVESQVDCSLANTVNLRAQNTSSSVEIAINPQPMSVAVSTETLELSPSFDERGNRLPYDENASWNLAEDFEIHDAISGENDDFRIKMFLDPFLDFDDDNSRILSDHFRIKMFCEDDFELIDDSASARPCDFEPVVNDISASITSENFGEISYMEYDSSASSLFRDKNQFSSHLFDPGGLTKDTSNDGDARVQMTCDSVGASISEGDKIELILVEVYPEKLFEQANEVKNAGIMSCNIDCHVFSHLSCTEICFCSNLHDHGGFSSLYGDKTRFSLYLFDPGRFDAPAEVTGSFNGGICFDQPLNHSKEDISVQQVAQTGLNNSSSQEIYDKRTHDVWSEMVTRFKGGTHCKELLEYHFACFQACDHKFYTTCHSIWCINPLKGYNHWCVVVSLNGLVDKAVWDQCINFSALWRVMVFLFSSWRIKNLNDIAFCKKENEISSANVIEVKTKLLFSQNCCRTQMDVVIFWLLSSFSCEKLLSKTVLKGPFNERRLRSLRLKFSPLIFEVTVKNYCEKLQLADVTLDEFKKRNSIVGYVVEIQLHGCIIWQSLKCNSRCRIHLLYWQRDSFQQVVLLSANFIQNLEQGGMQCHIHSFIL